MIINVACLPSPIMTKLGQGVEVRARYPITSDISAYHVSMATTYIKQYTVLTSYNGIAQRYVIDKGGDWRGRKK